MEAEPKFLTLEQIKVKYPPEQEWFEHKARGHEPVDFFMEVCRDENYVPLWFGRAHIIPRPSRSPSPAQKSD